MGGRAPLSKLDRTGSRLRRPFSLWLTLESDRERTVTGNRPLPPPLPPRGAYFTAEGRCFSFVDQPHATDRRKKKTVLLREIESALRAKRLCAREPYIKSTAMRVISRAGDFEARPLKRMLWKAEIGRRPSLAGIQVW